MANYALINPVDDVDTVINVIVADPEFIDNLEGYEFKLDISLYSPEPGIGWTYDSGEDTFAPPPIDYDQDFKDAIIHLKQALMEALDTRSAVADSPTAASDLGDVDISDLSENAAENLWPTIVSYLTDNDD